MAQLSELLAKVAKTQAEVEKLKASAMNEKSARFIRRCRPAAQPFKRRRRPGSGRDFAQRRMAGRAAEIPLLKPLSLTRKAVKSRRCRDRAKECNRASRRLTWTLKSDGQQDKIIVALAEMGEYRASSCYRAAVDLLRRNGGALRGQFSAGKLLPTACSRFHRSKAVPIDQAVSDRWAWRDCADTLTLQDSKHGLRHLCTDSGR